MKPEGWCLRVQGDFLPCQSRLDERATSVRGCLGYETTFKPSRIRVASLNLERLELYILCKILITKIKSKTQSQIARRSS